MFEGQYLFRGDAVYTPWMPRQGNAVRVAFDVIELNGLSLVVGLATKNHEETGNGIVRAAKLTISSTGVAERGWGGLSELVRFHYSNISGTTNTDYALFRMLTPTWYDEVKA